MLTKAVSIVLIALVVSSIAHAGASNGNLECVSESGKTKVNASIPGDFNEAAITVSIDGKMLTRINQVMEDAYKLNNQSAEKDYPGYEVATIASVNKISEKVFTIQALNNHYDSTELILFALPETIKGNGAHAKFRASLSMKDPRKSNSYIRDIPLVCTYDYSI